MSGTAAAWPRCRSASSPPACPVAAPVIPGPVDFLHRAARRASRLTLRGPLGMLARMDDQALVQAWRAGRRDAARETLIARHYAAVFRFFFAKVPLATGEDLAQRTFEVLCRGPGGIPRRGQLPRVPAGHRPLRAARPICVASGPSSRSRRLTLVCDDPSASEQIGAQQTLQLVATALRRLELDDQILIELKDWEGLSQARARRPLRGPAADRRAPAAARPGPPARRRRGPRRRPRRARRQPAQPRSCLQSIRADIDARWGELRPRAEAP